MAKKKHFSTYIYMDKVVNQLALINTDETVTQRVLVNIYETVTQRFLVNIDKKVTQVTTQNNQRIGLLRSINSEFQCTRKHISQPCQDKGTTI